MDLSNIGFTQQYKTKPIKRGEVYLFRQPNINKDNTSIQVKKRLFIVISNDIGNNQSPIFICVPSTSKPKKWLPTHVEDIYINSVKNVVLCEQIFTFDKDIIIDEEPFDILSDKDMEKIEKALIISLAIKCNAKPTVLMEKYYSELERRIREENFTYDKEGYLIKNKIIKIPVIEKYDIQDNTDKIELEKEVIKYKTEAEMYKRMYEQMFDKFVMNN